MTDQTKTTGRTALAKHYHDYYNGYQDHAERRADAVIAALAEMGFCLAPADGRGLPKIRVKAGVKHD